MYSWMASRSRSDCGDHTMCITVQATLCFIVRNTFGPIELGQSGLDFGQEYQPFYRIVDRGVGRHCLERFDDAIAGEWLFHSALLIYFVRPVEVNPTQIPGTY